MRCVSRFLAAVVLVVVARPGAGQELPTIPDSPTTVTFAGTTDDLTALTGDFIKGDWDQFGRKAWTLLTKACPLEPAEAAGGFCPVVARDYVLLVWVGRLPTATNPTLLSAVLHRNRREPYSRVVPGLQADSKAKLYEIFLTDNPAATPVSYYVSTPVANPTFAKVPDVVKTFAGPLIASLDRLSPRTVELFNLQETPPAQPSLTAVVRRVLLRTSRASVEVTLSATLPLAFAQINEDIRDERARLIRRGLTGTDRLGMALDGGAAKLMEVVDTECRADKLSAADCRERLHRGLSTVINPLLQQSPASTWEQNTLEAIDRGYREFIDGLKPDTVSGKAALENSPLTHLGFGAVTAMMFGTRLSQTSERAVLDDNVVTQATLPRALQIVTLNISPWGYQEKTPRRWTGVWPALRPFVGVAYAPDFGVAAGVTFMVLPNIGVTVGGVRLLISRPQKDLKFGDDLTEKVKGADDKPTDEFKFNESLRHDPFRRGFVDAGFAGVSFNF